MKDTDVRQGTLALMVLKTLDVLGPIHGYAIARRIEQISGDLLTVNQGTLYPVLLKLEQEGSIASEWGASENNRRARFYRLTRQGRKQLQAEARSWEQTAAIIERFFAAKAEDLNEDAEAALPQVDLVVGVRPGRGTPRAEFDEHIVMQTAENLRAGLSPIEARRQALLKFGNVEAIKETYRDARGLPFLETLVRDARHAIRGLRRTPAFTVAVTLTLALVSASTPRRSASSTPC
jgi:transcriptional regulator